MFSFSLYQSNHGSKRNSDEEGLSGLLRTCLIILIAKSEDLVLNQILDISKC